MARVKKISAALAWLPGFAPDEDPIEFHGASSDRKAAPAASVIVSEDAEREIWQANVVPFRRNGGKATPKVAKPVWPILDQTVFDNLAGDVTKFNANVTAIELLRKLEAEIRQPTEEERSVLNQYTGWGGLPKALNTDQKDPAWAGRAASLKAMLEPGEWESANASTPNAHYTSIEVVEAMWDAVQRMGFKGGRILEPAAGVGYFLGAMPEDMARNSIITAIELDDLSGRLLKALYQPFDVRVVREGFEKTRLPVDYFDLAIGNVPFGNYQVPESRNVPFQKFLIHDYFFARALEVVRPGGLVAFITSSGTMDKHDAKVRQYLATKADLVGAIRLPNTAFATIANTSVTTDILFFQKPLAGKPEKKNWMDVVEVKPESPLYGEAINWGRSIYMGANKHFVNDPNWVIGTLKQVSNGFTKTTGCVFHGDLKAALGAKVALLPSGIYSSKEEEVADGKVIKLDSGEHYRPGFRVIDGLVYVIHDGEEAVLYKAPAKTLERIGGMVHIREAARKLVASQAVTEDEGLLTTYRMALNIAYDRFVAKHGFIHARANRQAFKGDPDMPLLMALELWDDETETAEKADIFMRRTVGVFKHVEHCETVQEALVASMVERGRINEDRIAELTGIPAGEAMQELEDTGAVFLDPEMGRWETADAYLSGNVRHKLIAAETAGQRYERNAKALEAVIPADLTPTEIGARVGSTWIPTSDYEAFLNETFDCDSNKVTLGSEVQWNRRSS
jgi:adenine-specific DNA methylase